MQTSIHIRLNNATGQRFVKKLQDMGYSVMPNNRQSYYMHNPSDGRVLIEEETSGDLVIKQFFPKTPESEIVDLLHKTAIAAKGDFYIDQDANGDEISIVGGVDAPQPQVQMPSPQTQMQQSQQQAASMQQNAPQANMDPEFYKKLMMDAMGKIMQMFALGHTKPEDLYTQATRLQSATWITAGLTGGFLDAADVSQVMNDTKSAIQRIPQEIQNAVQGFQKKQQQMQQGFQTMTPAYTHDFNQTVNNAMQQQGQMPDPNADTWEPGF